MPRHILRCAIWRLQVPVLMFGQLIHIYLSYMLTDDSSIPMVYCSNSRACACACLRLATQRSDLAKACPAFYLILSPNAPHNHVAQHVPTQHITKLPLQRAGACIFDQLVSCTATGTMQYAAHPLSFWTSDPRHETTQVKCS